jgi:dedicated sortase system histidine kinase
MSIRTKLLLLSIAVLSIPYVGYQYLREMEQYLRDSMEASLLDTAIAVSGPLHNQTRFFPDEPEPQTKSIFVHRLSHPIQLDGYTGDWLSYISWSDSYSSENLNGEEGLSFKFIISSYQQYFYALLQVDDDRLVYRNPGRPGSTDNDHVSLVFNNPGGDLIRYYFSPADAGEFTPFELVSHVDEFGFSKSATEYRTNVSAVWRETDRGYNLEMSIPVNIVKDRLGIVVTDVDDELSHNTVVRLGTAGRQSNSTPGRILQSSPLIEKIISSYARVEGRRIWVLDEHGQVLASAGDLAKDLSGASVNFIYRLILPPVHRAFTDDLSGASRLQGEEINNALYGKPGSRWRSSPDDRAIIVSAAAPVFINDRIAGVTVIEETTNHIQIQQRQAMASLFNKSLFVFMFVTVLLLLFATRLSVRIRQLEKQADAAIDTHGRVVGEFYTSRASDEIGDLSRNYAAMLKRLKHYNDYLENMAGRLSHELRTPITVVQSSLDQFNDADTDKQRMKYLQRASEGINRLNTIVIRLSESTRLDQALQSAEKNETEINTLIQLCVEGYRSAYPQVNFEVILPKQSLVKTVATDLIVQMLDKLVKNAIDFKQGDEPVQIEVNTTADSWEINVINFGSTLPDVMSHQLFNSMVSVRDGKKGPEPHLGLGLYIVRLIAEFHGGHVSACNIDSMKGVKFTVNFPLNAG